MQYLIASDIHGSLPRLEKLMRYFEEMNMDMLVLLGDLLNYGPRNSVPEGLDAMGVANCLNTYADRIIAVKGNCDSEVDQMVLNFSILSNYALVVDNGVRILLTHGQHLSPHYQPSISYDILCYGHTHRWLLENHDGKIYCNVGSITFPKDGNEPTFATYADRHLVVRSLQGNILKEMVVPESQRI